MSAGVLFIHFIVTFFNLQRMEPSKDPYKMAIRFSKRLNYTKHQQNLQIHGEAVMFSSDIQPFYKTKAEFLLLISIISI